MAMVSTEELFKALNEDRTKPKKKALIRNEIVKTRHKDSKKMTEFSEKVDRAKAKA